jgi:hypothetical protein
VKSNISEQTIYRVNLPSYTHKIIKCRRYVVLRSQYWQKSTPKMSAWERLITKDVNNTCNAFVDEAEVQGLFYEFVSGGRGVGVIYRKGPYYTKCESDRWLLVTKCLVWCRIVRWSGGGASWYFFTPRTAFSAFPETDFWIYNSYIIL